MITNIMNFISKYYKSINKEKIVHTIVNLLIAIIIFLFFYTVANLVSNKIKNANFKMILKENRNTTNIEIPKPNREDSKIFSQMHKNFLAQVVFYILIFIGIIFAFTKLGININSLLVLLGTIGVGIAFGFKNYISQIISGIGILVLNYFNIGDLIQVDKTIGYVQNFNLLNTTLITYYGESIVVPNNLISSDSLTNITRNKAIFVLVPAVLSNVYKIDYPRLLKIIEEKVKLSKYVIDKNEFKAIVYDMAREIKSGEGGTTIAVRAKIESANYYEGLNDIRLLLRQTLEDEDIKLFDWHCSIKKNKVYKV
jgi:small-conductance mechanosensitive channel